MPPTGPAGAQGQTGTAGGKGGAAKPPSPRSFLSGTQKIYEGGDYDQTQVIDTNNHDLTPWQVQPTGFLAEEWLLVEGTAQNNGNTVAFNPNGPMAVFNSTELDDVNSEPIWGPFDGWTATCVTNKFGAYGFSADPRDNVIFYASTGSGATAGSFRFAVRVPMELVQRDALGSVPSESNTASLTYRINTAPLSTIYATQPNGTTPLTLRVRGMQRAYWPPKSVDAKTGRQFQQAPPLVNTTQYWSRGTTTVNAGTINQQLTGAWLGYPIRNYVFQLLDSNNSRAQGDLDWPDPFTLKYEGNLLVNALPKKLWERQMGEDYGYQNGAGPVPAKDIANGLEYGIYVLPFNKDFALAPGAETRRTFLPTRTGSTVAAIGSVGGSGTHTILSVVNYVAAANGNVAGLSNGR